MSEEAETNGNNQDRLVAQNVDVQDPAMLQRNDEQRNERHEQPILPDDRKALIEAAWKAVRAHKQRMQFLRALAFVELLQDLRYTAKQIFLFIDRGEFIRTGASLFKRLGEDDERLRAAATALDVSPEVFITEADQAVILEEGEADLNADELDVEVKRLAPRITDAVQAKANWACKVVLSYAKLQEVFKEFINQPRSPLD